MAKLSLSGIGDKIAAMVHAATHRNFPRVLANSMPKAGTHLLTRLLTLFDFYKQRGFLDIGPNEGLQRISPDYVQRARDKLAKLKPGFFVRTHMYFYPEVAQIIDEFQIRTITIVRDPRDVCVSDALHILKRPDHRLHSYYVKMSESQRLMASIVGMESARLGGDPPSLDIGLHYRNYLGWVQQSSGLVVKFEDLIGHKGGGDDLIQMETVAKIASYLGLQVSRQKITEFCNNLFWTKAKTFRKGQIGDWEKHFSSEHVAAFEKTIGHMMHDFGYYE
jgi:hypothetical protein